MKVFMISLFVFSLAGVTAAQEPQPISDKDLALWMLYSGAAMVTGGSVQVLLNVERTKGGSYVGNGQLPRFVEDLEKIPPSFKIDSNLDIGDYGEKISHVYASYVEDPHIVEKLKGLDELIEHENRAFWQNLRREGGLNNPEAERSLLNISDLKRQRSVAIEQAQRLGLIIEQEVPNFFSDPIAVKDQTRVKFKERGHYVIEYRRHVDPAKTRHFLSAHGIAVAQADAFSERPMTKKFHLRQRGYGFIRGGFIAIAIGIGAGYATEIELNDVGNFPQHVLYHLEEP